MDHNHNQLKPATMINENEFNNYYTNSNVQNNHINKQKQMHFDIFFEDHISNLSQLSDEDNQGIGTISLQQNTDTQATTTSHEEEEDNPTEDIESNTTPIYNSRGSNTKCSSEASDTNDKSSSTTKKTEKIKKRNTEFSNIFEADTNKPYTIPPNLRIPFRNPMLSKANPSSTTNPPTITPQQQSKPHKPNDANLTNLKQNEVATPILTTMTFAQTVPNHNSHPNHNDKTLQNTEEMLAPIATANHTPLPMETPTQAKKTNIPKNPYSTNRNNQQQNQNIQHNHLPSNAYIKKKLYHSPYLSEDLKPSPDTLELGTDLLTLKPLILSQHEAFTEFIKDLGNANITLT